jgi:hypothetical protein
MRRRGEFLSTHTHTHTPTHPSNRRKLDKIVAIAIVLYFIRGIILLGVLSTTSSSMKSSRERNHPSTLKIVI